MSKKPQLIKALLFGFLIFQWSIISQANELFPEIMPDPVYTPEEVVGIQMRALASNNKPFKNAGIELTFRFASPNNKSVTGPLERFATLFESSAYSPMINHQSIELGEPTLFEKQAMIPVLIKDVEGNLAGYMFTLTQQSAKPYENCWMTDKVIRVPLPKSESNIL